MKQIELTRGQVTTVDDEDWEYLIDWKWYAMKDRSGNYYAARNEGGKKILMHRVIGRCPRNKQVDHINGKTLENCRENLRVCTNQQNHWNQASKKRYKGTTRNHRKWQAQIQGTYIGTYPSEKEAAQAYDEQAKKLFGSFARLNFPEGAQA